VPYSCSAWIHSIHRGVDVARAAGARHVAGSTGATSEDAVRRRYDLPDFALLDMGDFAGGLLKYLRDHPVERLTIAGGFGKLTQLAQGALDLHSSRSQVDLGFLAELAGSAGAPAALVAALRTANTAADAATKAVAAGVPLARLVAEGARATAQRALGGAQVAVGVLVVGRDGSILAETADG
jgi:cobalt-precorrin-5B (C1)-methyltransferase